MRVEAAPYSTTPGEEPLDLSNILGIVRACFALGLGYADQFKRRGRGFAETFVFVRRAVDITPGSLELTPAEPYPGVRVVLVQPDSGSKTDEEFDRLKEEYHAFITRFAKASDSVGVLMLCESWLALAMEGEENMKPRKLAAPRRKEGLVMTLHHHEMGVFTWVAMIDRNPTVLHDYRLVSHSGAGETRGDFQTAIWGP